MFKIMLCCSADVHQPAGQQNGRWAKERGLAVKLMRNGVSEFDTQFPQYQVVLLGPQVKYMLPDTQTRRLQKVFRSSPSI